MATQKKSPPVRGLEGVVAGDTEISYVDGDNGELYYRGYHLDELAGKVSYEELVYLLWYGKLPNKKELEAFASFLTNNMKLPPEIVEIIQLAPPRTNLMTLLRTCQSALGMFDPDGGKISEEANNRKSVRILAQNAAIVAAIHRLEVGEKVLSPSAKMGFAENFLYMFFGRKPNKLDVQVFDCLLVLHADHGLAASSFAARVTVSTLAGMHSAITTALATLKGRLHGGANTRVMQMLEEIDSPTSVKKYISTMLSDGKKVMGFGHRMYKVEDPRSRHLRKYSQKLVSRPGVANLYEISQRIEKQVMQEKGIFPNIDFYSATVQHALGIPKEYFTCIFAVARTAGWIAHIREQFADNRLIRPTSRYIGGYGNKFVPIDKRE
ncbi:MAG: citrate synthase [Deltaproteobacteria bacterium]|nr:citrate synthase [Deltaproteobacteria bacterium]